MPLVGKEDHSYFVNFTKDSKMEEKKNQLLEWNIKKKKKLKKDKVKISPELLVQTYILPLFAKIRHCHY